MTRAIAVLLLPLLLLASYPWCQYDLWQSFEGGVSGEPVTAAQLATSSYGIHGKAGTYLGSWSDASVNGLVTTETDGEDPSNTLTRHAGTKGIKYASVTGAPGYITYTLPSATDNVSVGMWYRRGVIGSTEGPHFVTFVAASQLTRISDEKNSITNDPQFRVSPAEWGDNAAKVEGMANNTWYWITARYVRNGATDLMVYDASLNLLGSATWTDGTGVTNSDAVTKIALGNFQQTAPAGDWENRIDDFVVDRTDATFPLLPSVPLNTTRKITGARFGGAARVPN